jgi:hypothetical protein
MRRSEEVTGPGCLELRHGFQSRVQIWKWELRDRGKRASIARFFSLICCHGSRAAGAPEKLRRWERQSRSGTWRTGWVHPELGDVAGGPAASVALRPSEFHRMNGPKYRMAVAAFAD